MQPVVCLSSGVLRGEDRRGVSVFRGIPYGTAKRFERAVPAPAWDGVRDAVCNGPIAVQLGGSISGSEVLGPYFSGGHPEKFGVAEEKQGEDCLALNVLTPDLAGKKPVLVYIHGGGFSGGSGSLVIGSDDFVREQDVVLVGINHRLNAFGYLYLADLLPQYPDAGIVGMLDLVLALQWVRDNIAAFGGDPALVTVLGESGGGMKISTLLAMPEAAGLFARAVVESGSDLVGLNTPERAKTERRAFLQKLGLTEEEAAQLLTLPAEKIAAATTGCFWEPVADGVHLAPNAGRGFYAPGQSKEIPLMVGSSQDELAVFLPPELFGAKNRRDILERMAKRPLLTPGEAGRLSETDMEAVIEVFLQNNPKDDDAEHLFFKMCSMAGRLGGGAFRQAMAASAANTAPVYHYSVSYDAPLPGHDGVRCAWHTADLPLQMRLVLHPESEEISRTLSAAVGAFVRTGDPSTASLPWPAFDPTQRLTMVFDDVCRVERDPNAVLRRALEPGSD